jgi:hypothetical protein
MGLRCGTNGGNENKNLIIKPDGKKQTGHIVVDGRTILKII